MRSTTSFFEYERNDLLVLDEEQSIKNSKNAFLKELYMNKLVGPIPAELGGLKSLISLDVYYNNLTGPIPSSLSNLSNLRFFHLRSSKPDHVPASLRKRNESVEGLDLTCFYDYIENVLNINYLMSVINDLLSHHIEAITLKLRGCGMTLITRRKIVGAMYMLLHINLHGIQIGIRTFTSSFIVMSR
ncbi:hypothetical protein M9H77_30932 [Catharanthus roseus]|uniref:Uncharacterized protein n=1 Tax=Catharanthus roseus TaxID=4058 RepID=A0ACB9ZZQ8_CATRO|nr:hypothetical protein M9H77_30932 [Catharanthus roseus]